MRLGRQPSWRPRSHAAFSKRFPQEVGDRACEAVETPDAYGIESAPVGIGDEPVKFRSAILRTGGALIDVRTSEMFGGGSRWELETRHEEFRDIRATSPPDI